MDHVKEKILTQADTRLALWEQLKFSLDGEPDPWFEHAQARVDTRQFQALELVAPSTP